jgi:signal transduction histidine kinase
MVGEEFVLRATIDTEVINRLVRSLAASLRPSGDAFIINSEGVLQTPSRLYGAVMERPPLPALPYSTEVNVVELEDENGEPLIVSYVQIERSPFTLVLLSPRGMMQSGWVSLRRELLGFLAISIVLILAVVVGGSTYMVNRARDSDLKRAALYHKMEYTNKLAAIGRLGAGVAHEINNPLSIITEKGGLLKDLLTMSEELPPREKLIDLVQSVLKAADRCGGITHRLLGFAKHMDVERETINLDALLHEVLGFLEKEASYRNLRVDFNYSEEPPTIVSDRGQLQQIFLNIINNAFAAVEDGGHIEIGIERVGADAVAVTIADDGVGIPADQLTHIFDPFFTTKKGAGTGLGLSITYGIVQKLGGQIGVKSKLGEGTCFTVTLPIGRALA